MVAVGVNLIQVSTSSNNLYVSSPVSLRRPKLSSSVAGKRKAIRIRAEASITESSVEKDPNSLSESDYSSSSDSGVSDNGRSVLGSVDKKKKNYKSEIGVTKMPLDNEIEKERRLSIEDYLEGTKDLISRKWDGDGRAPPPRWFSPLECASRLDNSPLLFFLPGLMEAYQVMVKMAAIWCKSCFHRFLGAVYCSQSKPLAFLARADLNLHLCTGIDGVGLGLILHHQRLGKIFDIWCLHIPVMNRTPFTELVQLIEKTVKSEHSRSPNRPIYLVGESLGACLALAVAALNSDIDLTLILSNPATSFRRSQLQTLTTLLEVMPEQLPFSLPYNTKLFEGDPLRMMMASVGKGLPFQQTVGELSESLGTFLHCLSVLPDILPRETLLWKLRMIRSASSFANSRLHAVKAQTLILSSGRDQLLPSQEEAERLRHTLPDCRIRNFKDSGHTLFMEDGVDLVTIIKGANFYRRTRHVDHVLDYVPLTPSEFKEASKSYRWLDIAASPVMLSTLENGKIVRSLAGIPSEGPVLFVGYHMLLGWELSPLVCKIFSERNIHVRGVAHPLMWNEADGMMQDSSAYDTYRVMGAVPVSATNLYKLFATKSHVLLYPGGVREALHRKGEEYKLFWPERSEFVRMAARFGAKIIPFGVVGEDDVSEVVLDYEDLMKIPYFRTQIKELNKDVVRLRTDVNGELGNQDLHLPIVLPKLPGRFYYLFGKPIETEGRKTELRDKEQAHELYLEVKSEVENCIAYLKEKREKDLYRNILPRLVYQATHGIDSEIPTFEL
ncbi:acyltransferase-like protein At3g26840, chloroplastic isoform X3 [Macadamia integrifolia]|uniref:acyltransferase-like protein At3g26840, chloroplastic isoform X2 n=1 Tax=Macadamia integrifolia TaxID=60698 RepID=UPI001C4F40CF|nr:acyltransferase-like protein At3g26840, chloroplastic isoform X2 [Macadamia integrifolia]XP_042501766.1 acyltransferase-like protein At3g26840, chloroplastic isoform X3 [Macadamia integrifolia]